MKTSRFQKIGLLGALAVVISLAGISAAASAGQRSPSAIGGSIFRVITKSSAAYLSTTSMSYTVLQSVNFNVPNNVVGIAQFQATDECTGPEGETGGWCLVQLTIDGQSMNPVTPDRVLDTEDGTPAIPEREAHELDGSFSVGPGLHTVQVLWRVGTPGMTFVVDDYHLTLLLARG